MKKYILSIAILFIFFGVDAKRISIVCNQKNDLYLLLKENKIDVDCFNDYKEAINLAPKNSGVIITANKYPFEPNIIEADYLFKAHEKKLRLYIEFVNDYPNVQIEKELYSASLERGVVTSNFFYPYLKSLDLLGLNDCKIYKAKITNPLLGFAKVAGFDKAQYGLDDTDVIPLLFKDKNNLISLTSLSCFKTARYAPNDSWSIVWSKIIGWLISDDTFSLFSWSSDPSPSYDRLDVLPKNARSESISRGSEWIYNGRFLIHPSWKEVAYNYQGDGLYPFGPPVSFQELSGNGSEGVLEGHASNIYYDGTEQYRYWLRNDVQGEVAFLLAAASNVLDNSKYAETAENLLDYMFYNSPFRKGARSDKDSASYGLLGWSYTHPYVFYNDDNARAILGAIGASTFLNNKRWNTFIVECIIANLRTSSKQGFQGGRLEEPDILKNGWQFYNDRDYTNPHPHFESWMWACYLWLYDKTGYKPLLDKAKSAIRITMDAYPNNWNWTNGIQQERARMILPLAWLVRIDDTEEHRLWLDKVVTKLLENQVSCGAIREELGKSETGLFGNAKSNKEYGITEAPLIAKNGDPVSDMLYTCNFAFFALNEAACATNNIKYKDATNRLSEFLIRIQAKSDSHPDLDGAWMRAFDYDRWDYWASNADHGWGAWSTLTGWIQSWIVGTQSLIENQQSFWELTKGVNLDDEMKNAMWMLDCNQ